MTDHESKPRIETEHLDPFPKLEVNDFGRVSAFSEVKITGFVKILEAEIGSERSLSPKVRVAFDGTIDVFGNEVPAYVQMVLPAQIVKRIDPGSMEYAGVRDEFIAAEEQREMGFF